MYSTSCIGCFTYCMSPGRSYMVRSDTYTVRKIKAPEKNAKILNGGNGVITGSYLLAWYCVVCATWYVPLRAKPSGDWGRTAAKTWGGGRRMTSRREAYT